MGEEGLPVESATRCQRKRKRAVPCPRAATHPRGRHCVALEKERIEASKTPKAAGKGNCWHSKLCLAEQAFGRQQSMCLRDLDGCGTECP